MKETVIKRKDKANCFIMTGVLRGSTINLSPFPGIPFVRNPSPWIVIYMCLCITKYVGMHYRDYITATIWRMRVSDVFCNRLSRTFIKKSSVLVPGLVFFQTAWLSIFRGYMPNYWRRRPSLLGNKQGDLGAEHKRASTVGQNDEPDPMGLGVSLKGRVEASSRAVAGNWKLLPGMSPVQITSRGAVYMASSLCRAKMCTRHRYASHEPKGHNAAIYLIKQWLRSA